MKKVKIWDLPTRLFHWALVISFTAAAYSAFQDKFDIWAAVHRYAGYSIIALVSWRLVWGLIGSQTAKLRGLYASPRAVKIYLQETIAGVPYSHVGHNPLGGWVVLIMLFGLLFQAAMGLFSSDDMFFEGPYSHLASSLPFAVNSWHENLGLFLIGLASVHILVVLAYRLILKKNLITPMITGWRMASDRLTPPRIAPIWRAALVAVIIAAGLYYWIM